MLLLTANQACFNPYYDPDLASDRLQLIMQSIENRPFCHNVDHPFSPFSDTYCMMDFIIDKSVFLSFGSSKIILYLYSLIKGHDVEFCAAVRNNRRYFQLSK